ncbi:MAG: ribosome silencing factor [Treponema sp.]|jgi:ribosome-associated protein|nr:ribosome silencing factor [Treponema sp.]
MADTLQTSDKDLALELGTLLHDYRAEDVIVMDLRKQNTFADFFVIVTATSSAQVQGLQKHIKDFCSEKDLEILRRQRKVPTDEEWSLVDLGNIIVHLMTERARKFYELERLWSDAEIIFKAED